MLHILERKERPRNGRRTALHNSNIKEKKYLGQTITSNGKCDDEILKRIEMAGGAFNSMLKSITAKKSYKSMCGRHFYTDVKRGQQPPET